MFHSHPDRSTQISPDLSTQTKMREIVNTFEQVTGYSIDDLSRKHYQLDKIDELVLKRTGRVVDNYARLQAFLEDGCQLVVAGSGDSPICSALATEAINLRTALELTAKESEFIAIAQSGHGLGVFRNPEFPYGTHRMEPYLEDWRGVVDEMDIKKPQIKMVDDRGKIINSEIETRQVIARRLIEMGNEEIVRRALRRIAFPVQEIGIDAVDNTKKYLTIGAIGAGATGAIILAVIVHNKRQKPK